MEIKIRKLGDLFTVVSLKEARGTLFCNLSHLRPEMGYHGYIMRTALAE